MWVIDNYGLNWCDDVMLFEWIDIVIVLLLICVGYLAYKEDIRLQLILVFVLVGLTLLF